MVDYSYHDWKGWAAQDFGAYSVADAAYFRVEVFSRPSLRCGAHVLEIGFGNGCFLGCARAAGFKVTGTEINAELCRRAANAGFEVLDSLEDAESASFDAVVLFDVLEHLRDDAAIALLRQILRCVRPGGLVILRFPNGDSPFGLVHQYGDVTHINVIGSIKIGYFAGAASLDLVEVSNPATPFHGLGFRRQMRRALRLVMRRCIEEVLGRTFYGHRRPLAQNLVAVMRRPA